MNIHKIEIEGFKSIGKISIVEPNHFSVFVGPNAAGKSNIFEALEFLSLCNILYPLEVVKLFGKNNEILNQLNIERNILFLQVGVDLGKINSNLGISFVDIEGDVRVTNAYANNLNISSKIMKQINPLADDFNKDESFKNFFNFSRLFVGKRNYLSRNDDSKLSTDASNLEKVLNRILKNESIREEILEILQLLIPGFSKVEIVTEPLSGNDNLLVYEESLPKPLKKSLISDGTYNILSIITALYQSEEPQFLCIEEPENGLNPKVVRELVKIIRQRCKEKGYYVWLNTHSQTLVSELTKDEIILVDKHNGLTEIKQVKDIDIPQGLKMDEALLTNVLGGGIPW